MIKLLILVLLSLAGFNLVLAQEEVELGEPQQGSTISRDYLVQLLFSISESRIPNYLVGVIYNRPLEKEISTQAVLDLYQTNNISLNTTQNILGLLNISQEQVFSINGFNYTLESFNWTFTAFYTSLTNRLNLTGVPLRNALIALQIDVNQFSAGITWGDPDPWQEFIRGNFTQASMELACSEAGITIEALWAGARDIFLTSLISYDIQNFVQLLLNHSIGQQHALIIWNAVPVTVQHVYSLPLYSNIIGNFSARINSQTALGVLTGVQQVVVHRSIHEVFREERDLLDIRAQTLLTRTTLDIGIINDTIYRNLVVLRHSAVTPFENITVINVANQNSNLTNCSYVTFQNNNILAVNVPTATFFNETYEIPRSVIQNVVLGSALVCNNTVYGLARGVVENNIVADAFSNIVAPSSANSLFFGRTALMGSCLVAAIKLLLF